MNQKVELLAPCGNYDCFLAAVNAGADAVYLAGNRYGARAYADNFDEETLIKVIRLAHLWNVRVYLTINTLLKQTEISELYDYVLPYVRQGIDGVIVQDMGVFWELKNHFPGLELHASTQMSITSKYGAKFMYELGCTRIVPARELHLDEIIEIKKEVPIEIEAFIHGAMCYSYSGRCLMSSFIGGRSGNRGRCAQPCRLPYKINGEEDYVLSLKDMCTIQDIPRLIDAGIDSFKIEGRMKKPEYVAGVVSVYRKYIDLYYNNPTEYRVETQDIENLKKLYLRNELCKGYYDCLRGPEMITWGYPGYKGADDAQLKMLHARYVRELPSIPLDITARFISGDKSVLESSCILPTSFNGGMGEKQKNSIEVTITGLVVDKAQKRFTTEDEIYKQLSKFGNTPFALNSLKINTSGDCFIPVKCLNDLRRALVDEIFEKIIELKNRNEINTHINSSNDDMDEIRKTEISYDIVIMRKEQVLPALHSNAGTIIFDLDLIIEEVELEGRDLSEYESIVDIFRNSDQEIRQSKDSKKSFGIKMPEIIRKSDEKYFSILSKLRKITDAVLCPSIDSLKLVIELGFKSRLIGDTSLYGWNDRSVLFYKNYLSEISAPLEYNSGEIRELTNALGELRQKICAVVYGRTPLMVSANCIKLSTGKCDRSRNFNRMLEDRMNNKFPVYTNCNHCYNVVYNYLPTAIMDNVWMLLEDGIRSFRLSFTDEDSQDVEVVIQTFEQALTSNKQSNYKAGRNNLPFKVTAGHMKRGVL